MKGERQGGKKEEERKRGREEGRKEGEGAMRECSCFTEIMKRRQAGLPQLPHHHPLELPSTL